MAIMLTKVEVNGLDIQSKLIKWQIEETFGIEISEAQIEVTKSIYDQIPDLRPGYAVTIKRGFNTSTDQFAFNGYIDRIDKAGATITIYAQDRMTELLRRMITYSYDGGAFPGTEAKGSDIARDMIENYAGMQSTVVDTGVNLLLAKFICNGVSVFSRLQVLADIYDYQFYYDPDDNTVHFEPKGYLITATQLVVGGPQNNCADVPTWTFDNSQCVNSLIVKGAVQVVQDEELFNGTGVVTPNQQFTLSKKPIGVQVWEDMGSTPSIPNWVLKIPGVEGSTSGTYDYTIDKEAKLIKCQDAWVPGAGSNNIRIDYSSAIPVPVQVEDTVSISRYGMYKAEKIFSDIQDVADAEKRGNAWLDLYSVPFVKVTLKPINTIDYDPGTRISVNDTINQEARELVINKIIKKYPHSYDELQVGDKEYQLAEWGKFTLERIRRLEEENQKNVDLLINIVTLSHYVKLRWRYVTVQRNSANANMFILSNPYFAILGTHKLGGNYTPDQEWRVIFPFRTYSENFMDNDFKDTGTGNWNNTSRSLTLT